MEWKQGLLQKAILREVQEEEGRRGKARGRGRGRGRFSKLPSARDLARRILEAEQVMEQSSSDPEMAISTTTTRSQSNLRSSHSEVHIEVASQSEPQIEDASQSELHQQRRSHRRQPDVESYAPRRSTRGNNPPFVAMFLHRSRYKCIGCNKWINKKDHPHPKDLMFTLKAIRPFLIQKTQEWVHPEKNGYFHLDIKCLQMHDSTIEMRQVTITDENFLMLSQQQLEFLSAEGYPGTYGCKQRKDIVRYVETYNIQELYDVWTPSIISHLSFVPNICTKHHTRLTF